MEHLKSSELLEKFGTVSNYGVLTGMLGFSALIGVYFWRKDQSSAEDTLVGGRSLPVLPVTASLVASYLSALTLLGMPAEVYTQGTQFLAVLATIPVIAFLTSEVYMPLFHNLQVQSSYQYLEWRFNSRVKLFAGGFFAVAQLIYIAIIVYLPAMALEQVTGINVDTACALIFVVCVFYTSVGGIKAVIWTDVFQLFFMFLSIIAIIVLATAEAGGVSKVWDDNYGAGRIQFFNFSLDPRERHTFWGTTLGNGMIWLSAFGVNQTQFQRYLSLPTLKQARRAVVLNFTVMVCMILLIGWMGLMLYSVYLTCDPISAKQVRTKDQMLPLLVLHVAGDIPGLPGLFIAGVFSGSLSSISSGLNSLAAIALKDFVPANKLEKMSDVKQAFLTKMFSLVFGVVGYGLTYLIRFMPGMLEAAYVVSGVINGPITGLFTVGMLLPWVDSTGALVGFLGSLLFTGWIATSGTIYRGSYTSTTSPAFPNTTTGCPSSWLEDLSPSNVTSVTTPAGHIPLYDLSYIWYCVLGVSVVLLLSLVTTIFTSQDVRQLDARLLSPIVAKTLDNLPDCSITRKLKTWYNSIGTEIKKKNKSLIER